MHRRIWGGAKRGFAPPKIFNDAVTRKQVAIIEAESVFI